MSFRCRRFDQKTNEFFSRISALASKKRLNQNNKGTFILKKNEIIIHFFKFNLFLEARAEIFEKNSLVFWSKQRNPRDILKLTDLYTNKILKTSWFRFYEEFQIGKKKGFFYELFIF